MFNKCSTVKAVRARYCLQAVFLVFIILKSIIGFVGHAGDIIYYITDMMSFIHLFLYGEKGSCYAIHSGCPRSH